MGFIYSVYITNYGNLRSVCFPINIINHINFFTTFFQNTSGLPVTENNSAFLTFFSYTYSFNKAYTHLFKHYLLIKRKTPLKHESTTLLFIALIRPIVTYLSPVWLGTSKTNFNKLQRLQSKILRISLKAPWFTQIYRDEHTYN